VEGFILDLPKDMDIGFDIVGGIYERMRKRRYGKGYMSVDLFHIPQRAPKS
jgi:hypothetical protein